MLARALSTKSYQNCFSLGQKLLSNAKQRSFKTATAAIGCQTLTAVKKFQKQELVVKQFSPLGLQIRLYADKSPNCTMDKEMEKHCVVPDVIPVGPKEACQVTYPSGAKVDAGNVLTPTQVKCAPVVCWPHDPKAMYTLVMTDPDAPSRGNPEFREWHHWLVGNIPGQEICKGEVLSAYVGSGPPPDTGLHRYVFLVYKQHKELCFEEKRLPNNSADGRGGFKIAEFARKYALGNPIAGNFYQAEWDDYVPILYKQLGA